MKRIVNSIILFSFLFISISYSSGYSNDLPSEEEVMGVVRLCGAGISKGVVADMEYSIKMWRTTARARADLRTEEIGAVFKNVVGSNTADIYPHYIDCVQNTLDKFLSRPKQKSTLERTTGDYRLIMWNAAHRPIELGAQVTKGDLSVDSDGIANWSVWLEQTYSSVPGKIKMTARGEILIDVMEIAGIKGGKYNSTNYLDQKWGQISSDVHLAVRGWNSGSPEDRFKLSLDTGSDGRQILIMRNSRGTFRWGKK